ncbi:MAG: electron transport complex subunit E [Clostridia bacterium]|nr:electron transport complex subunit E [Clostridia bacterium]
MKNKYFERIYNGLIKENPTFVLMLGMCPALAVTDTAIHGVSMGLSTLAVLVLSNFLISVMRNVIPDQVRLPSYIVIVASFVTIVSLLLQACLPSVYSALGAFIELIVVNCIILGRAEAYANKHTPGLSVMDGIGMGLGFTVALTLTGLVREFLGAGTAFDMRVFPKEYAVGIIKDAPGAFMVIALFIIIMNAIGIKTRQRELVNSNGCDGCCAKCAMRCEEKKEEEAK